MPNERSEPVIPDVTALKQSLVRVWEWWNRAPAPWEAAPEEPPAQVVWEATLAARLSARRCMFCKEERGGNIHAAVRFELHKLCGCCVPLLSTQDEWYANLREPSRVLRVLEGVDNGTEPPNRVLARRKCCGYTIRNGKKKACEEHFNYTAGALAHAVRGYLAKQRARGITDPDQALKDFQWPTKCRACRDETQRRMALKDRDKAAPREEAVQPTERHLRVAGGA